MKFTIIAENDMSKWEDDTGVRYHFPRRYRSLLAPGTRIIHYKGRLLDEAFAAKRRSRDPHYFGLSMAGNHSPDPNSTKGDLFVEILAYKALPTVVPIRVNGNTVEIIPENRKANYWRDGVRKATPEIFQFIAEQGGLFVGEEKPSKNDQIDELYTAEEEGGVKKVYSNRYERSLKLRAKAIAIHGTKCAACEISFSERYGAFAENYIQVHHKRPLSAIGGPTVVDPLLDLIPLCPNCHMMVHLGPKLRSVNEIRQCLGKPPIANGD